MRLEGAGGRRVLLAGAIAAGAILAVATIGSADAWAHA